MQVIETKVYTFDELSDAAKEKARQWYRETNDGLSGAENVIEDAKNIGALMGIDIKRVLYTGFWSQGDGACFEGTYSYKEGALGAVLEYAPLDTHLHGFAMQIEAIQKEHNNLLSATITHKGRYYHENCTEFGILKDGEYFFDSSDSYVRDNPDAALVEPMRGFMRWIYNQLEKDYNYQNSDETVDENIIANEYTFTESGKRFG